MLITTYTSYAEVRAALGVSALELTDTQLALGIYGEFLFQELSGVSGTLAPDTVSRNLIGHFQYISALTPTSSPSSSVSSSPSSSVSLSPSASNSASPSSSVSASASASVSASPSASSSDGPSSSVSASPSASASTAPVSQPTDDQNLLLSYIKAFATYTVAANVAGTISLLAPKTISDGKASTTRFSSERTFEAVVADVHYRKADLKRKIQELFGTAQTGKNYVGTIVPATDVVTGVAYE